MSSKILTDQELREWLDENKDSLTPSMLLRKGYEQHHLRQLDAQMKREAGKPAAVPLKDDKDDYQLSPIQLLILGYTKKDEE
jgi:hypothetical protein